MTTQARELAKLVNNAGDLSFSDDIHLLSDAGVLNFGADNDVTLTHVADTGLLLNSSRQLQFGDSGTFIRQEADGVLDLTSDTEIELNATTVDINANVDISGNLVLGGNITIGDADSDDISFGGELTSHIVPNADDTYDLGSSTKQWRNLYVDGSAFIDTIDGTDEISITNTATDSNAGPILNLWRNSASPADADYLGQIKFSGEDDGGTATVYSKITGKIGDASNSSEDGIIEFAAQKAGSQTILARLKSDKLELVNGTALEVSVDTDSVAEIGRAHVGGGITGLSDYAIFSHLHAADSGGYALAQNASGATFLNADDGQDITFLAHGTSIATLASDATLTLTGGLVIPSTITHAGDTDTKLDFNQANTMRLITGDGTAWICDASTMVINEDSEDRDFRVESNGEANMLFVDGGNDRVGIGTGTPDDKLDIMGGGYDQIRIGSNKTDNTNKTAGIVSTMYTNNSVSLFQLFCQNGNNSLYYGSADSNHRGLQNHYFYTNAGYNATSSHTKMMEINYFGQIKSGSGGMTLQTKEVYADTSTGISSGSSAVICSTTITVKANSKLAVWGHSGQIQNDGNGQNPNMLIQHVTADGNTTTNISDHNGNHYGWDASTHVERMFITSQGISAALSAGTYTVRLLGGAYNGSVTMNYQSQGSHMIIQEISAD